MAQAPAGHIADAPYKGSSINLLWKLLGSGKKPSHKELLAVIVEVGFDDGLDVLASFKNGTARYINQAGKILVGRAPRFSLLYIG